MVRDTDGALHENRQRLQIQLGLRLFAALVRHAGIAERLRHPLSRVIVADDLTTTILFSDSGVLRGNLLGVERGVAPPDHVSNEVFFGVVEMANTNGKRVPTARG